MNSVVHVLKNRYLPFLFAIPLFFCVLHYDGIVIDAVLYVTQYVFSIDPSRFLGDPAFDFGNQNSLGFFSPIFGVFIDAWGVAKGAFIYTVLMQFAWVVTAVFMIRSLSRAIKQRLWILPITILFVVFFANGMSFSHILFFKYISSYACSRSLSIVVGMGAVVLMFYQKKVLSLALVLGGLIVHPITAGWCLPFWMFYFFPKTKIPVAVFSLLFPLTFLLHVGPFDLFPQDWLARPLDFRPGYVIISRYLVLLVFLGMLARRSSNFQIRKICCSLSLITIIAFYWDIWGGFGEHILLYQVQPWRVVWLPSIIAAPLGVCQIKDSVRRYLKYKKMTTHDFGIALLVVSFLLPQNIILITLFSASLLIMQNKGLTLKWIVWTFVGVVFGGYLVQQYLTWCLQGFSPFLGYNYREISHLRDSFLICQFVFTTFFVVFFFNKQRFALAAISILSIFLSRFMLLPILPLFLFFFPRKGKLTFVGGVCLIALLTVFDGAFDIESRRRFMIDGMPLNFSWVCFSTILSFVVIVLTKKKSLWVIFIWLLVCSVVAMTNYSHHSLNWIEKEKRLDDYVNSPIFSQVEDRGKIFFYVSGLFMEEPRLRFMSGSYYSHSSDVGTIFNKMHYWKVLERSHLLYQKKINFESKKIFDYKKILNKIADSDSLIDRMEFLCGLNEIANVVTDKTDLPFVKEDSVMVGGSQKVYLYGCAIR